jgi:alginate O-acetyltransferase complex protein AlgI
MNHFNHWLSMALWLAGIGHFCILFASFQVPARLDWKKDLAQLTHFNRKLMWVYGGTTLLTIVAFGTLTLLLHHEFLTGNRVAVALAAFIAIFWTMRILVDFFYFEHSDWPTGIPFVVGHILLTTLFTALAATYWAVLIWSFAK